MHIRNALRFTVALSALVIGSGFASAQTATPTVLASGLQTAYRVILTPRGNLLVSEGGSENNGGRISVVTRGGNRSTLIAGLPSGKNAEAQVYIGPTGLALSGRTLYIVISNGDADVAGPTPGTTIPNPKGIASSLLSSVFAVQFSADIDTISAPFTIKPADQTTIADGYPATLDNGNGATADVSLLANFQDFTSNPVSIYKHSDPYAIALDPNDRDYLYVTDSGQDTVVRIHRETGRMRTVLRIPPIPSAVPGPPVSDPVPNSIIPYGNQFLVTQFDWLPFHAGRIAREPVRSANSYSDSVHHRTQQRDGCRVHSTRRCPRAFPCPRIHEQLPVRRLLDPAGCCSMIRRPERLS